MSNHHLVCSRLLLRQHRHVCQLQVVRLAVVVAAAAAVITHIHQCDECVKLLHSAASVTTDRPVDAPWSLCPHRRQHEVEFNGYDKNPSSSDIKNKSYVLGLEL